MADSMQIRITDENVIKKFRQAQLVLRNENYEIPNVTKTAELIVKYFLDSEYQENGADVKLKKIQKKVKANF